jgi:hypothetical protein
MAAEPDSVRDAELALVTQVAAFFQRHGMTSHLAHLRQYYREVRAGRSHKGWSRPLVHEWAKLLRLPPHENDYPVRLWGAPCTACEVSRPYTEVVFPGGHKSKCACGAAWLILDKS